jgi:hypothetical protein
MHKPITVSSLGALGALFAAFTSAGAQSYGPNGYGADPDGDSNPAVNTQLIVKIGDAAEASLDPPFRVVTFEAPPGSHGDSIRMQYADNYGVWFSRGLSRQICEGQRYFRYDSQCTYMRAPSGKYAALYDDAWGRPLRVRYSDPVCAAAFAIYPTGGEEGERFKITLQPYADDETKLTPVDYYFNWTQDTFRWRLMAEAFFLDQKANRVDVNIESKTHKEKVVRFLVDDVAYVSDECAQRLVDVAAEAELQSE